MIGILDAIRMSQAWMLEAYNDYLRRKDARQITFDEFCDNHYQSN